MAITNRTVSTFPGVLKIIDHQGARGFHVGGLIAFEQSSASRKRANQDF
jgi:hypothetical protein